MTLSTATTVLQPARERLRQILKQMDAYKLKSSRVNVGHMKDNNEVLSMHLTFLVAGLHCDESTPFPAFLGICNELKAENDGQGLVTTFNEIFEAFDSSKENDTPMKEIRLPERISSINSNLTERTRVSPPTKERQRRCKCRSRCSCR
jgi:hypothetical protein